jgi:hypothetical protein
MITFINILFPIAFSCFFFVFGLILFRSLKEWNKNNHSPRLTVDVTVVGRRQHRTHHTGDHMGHTHYYITFQVESGDRMELHVAGVEYGMLAEGDFGNLSFQGTRFLGFERS